jgi:hypothetical protein
MMFLFQTELDDFQNIIGKLLKCAPLRIAGSELRHLAYKETIFISFNVDIEIPLHF